MVGKPYVSAFQNFFWIENPLNIKEIWITLCIIIQTIWIKKYFELMLRIT